MKSSDRIHPKGVPVLHVSLYQVSIRNVDLDRIGLARDSFERNLPDFLSQALSVEELQELAGSTQGAPTRCILSKLAMMLLRFRYDLSERELVARCRRDLGFRYALGLEEDEDPPSERTYRRFQDRVQRVKGMDYLMELSLRVAVAEGVLDDTALQGIDSTNTDCRGAVIDTFNLVAAAIRQVIRVTARCLGLRPEELARRWELSRYMARSIKGAANIDWSDEQQRNELLTSEVRDADALVERVRELARNLHLPAEIEEVTQLLQSVSRQDVEELEDGTFRIAKGTAAGRIISVSDPEARHGRKSASKTINGFKTHIMGTIDSQFVTGIVITDAATHDAQLTNPLLEQAEAHGGKPDELLGDCAYGGGANLRQTRQQGVELHTKVSSPSARTAFPKSDFDIDVDALKVTCPAGVTTTNHVMVGHKDPDGPVPQFRFDKQDCRACPQRTDCCAATAKGGRRVIRLNPYERELQQNRAFAQTDRGKQQLRRRSNVERLISHLVRMGMRHARFFTMARVQVQAFMVAAAYNLQRFFTLRAGAT
jgi:IS5 family transposase